MNKIPDTLECTTPEGQMPYGGSFSNYYYFQKAVAEKFPGKLLNAACGADPSGLGDYGAINLDIQTREPSTGNDFSKVKNFVHGSVLDIPFPACEFDTVILGEFLEHCTKERAIQALKECSRVLVRGGVLGITVPLDGLSAVRKQRGIWTVDPRGSYIEGITHEHQSWWLDEDLTEFRVAAKFAEIARVGIYYFGLYPMGGWGLIWRRI